MVSLLLWEGELLSVSLLLLELERQN